MSLCNSDDLGANWDLNFDQIPLSAVTMLPPNGGGSPFIGATPCDIQYPIIGNSWLPPATVVYNITLPKEREFIARRLYKEGVRYFVRERTNRQIFVCILILLSIIAINPKPDGTCEAFLCDLEINENKRRLRVVIPYLDFVRQLIGRYLPWLDRNPDCPEQYISLAFLREVQNASEIKTMQLPLHPGMIECEGKLAFITAESMIPELTPYYAPSIVKRHLPHTDLALTDAAKGLLRVLPSGWRFKLLLVIAVTSLLLYFYERAGLHPDQFYVVGIDSEPLARNAIALLRNNDFDRIAVSSLSGPCSRAAVRADLGMMNDGLVLLRDTTLLENGKSRDSALEEIVNDLICGSLDEKPHRHMCVVLTGNPGAYASELPAFHIALDGSYPTADAEQLQKAVGAFSSALIRHLCSSDPRDNEVTQALTKTAFLTPTVVNSDCWMTERMIRTTAELLAGLRLILPEEMAEISHYLKDNRYSTVSSEQAVSNEFRHVLSDCILSGRLPLVKQYGSPFFEPKRIMGFIDAQHINLTQAALEKLILLRMTTTQKRNKLLNSLNVCGMLYHNHNLKRSVEAEVSPGVMEAFSVYSVPIRILTPEAKARVTAMRYADYLFRPGTCPQGFIPLLNVVDGKIAGRLIDDSTDEAESLYACGQTRSGKTYFLVQTAVIRAASGFRVIAFDQTGAFSPDELRKHLPEEIISEYFSFWDLGEKGLPVDILSLEGCKRLPEEKAQLAGVLSVLARLTGDVQLKTLRSRLAKIAKSIKNDELHSLE